MLVLLARRLADGAEPSELEQAVGAERVERLPVGPLSVGALHRLLRDRLGPAFARQTLLRIHERSGGNPFFALELARVLGEDVDPPEPLPVPDDARGAGARAASPGSPRPPATRSRSPRRSARRRSRSWSARALPADALEPAVAAHVIERESGTVRFTHPLLSSVLYRDLGDERRSVHARIAAIVDDPLLRARHLALSRDAPDADVAAVLDAAARLAADRGAAAVAAELAEQALRLTPPDARDERRRRALAAARAHHDAGEWTRARTIATELLAETELGPLRAEALVLLAELESVDRRSRCSRKRWRRQLEPGAPVGDPLPARVGDRFKVGRRARPRLRSSSPTSSTTTCSGRAPARCRPCSAGSPASGGAGRSLGAVARPRERRRRGAARAQEATQAS